MDQVTALEQLKSIKRRARLLYECSRVLYSDRLSNTSTDNRRVFYDAITALDTMYRMYEALKTGMRKQSINDQIKFAEKWDTYVSCIDTLTAYRSQDKYLLSYLLLTDEAIAKQRALEIWRDFNKQFNQKKSIH